MKRILITGGAGYVGSVLTRKLINLGFEVVILDTFFYTDIGISALLNQPSLRVVNGDIRDRAAVRTSLEGVDCVVHLAALANDPSAELNLKLTRQINLECYPILLNEACVAGTRMFINISSIGVYGVNYENNVTEDDPINPLTEYSRCKAESEELVKRSSSDKFTAVSIRCGTICGWSPRMRFDLCTNTLAAYAISRKKLTVWGGNQRRPQIHIDDATDFIISLLTAPAQQIGGRIFNAAGHNMTVQKIAETIKEVMDGKLELTNAPARSDERTYHVSSERIVRELGFTMKMTVRDAIVEIMNAYQAGLWVDPDDAIYHNIQRLKQMGESARC